MPIDTAQVVLWGNVIGVLAWDEAQEMGVFEYAPEFRGSGIEVAPLMMPLGRRVYTFPELARESFHGLPGMLADSLPDKFGNLLIDEWLIREGRTLAGFTPLERLCYIGARGMGALEFRPEQPRQQHKSTPVEVDAIVELANRALAEKQLLNTRVGRGAKRDGEAMRDILRVGTSAGGARAKAIIAWNEATNEIRSGQARAPEGFTYWLLKLDGVSGNRDKDLEDPKGFGKIEYAYYLMARAAGIEMSESRLLEENGRSHFMSKRFDRTDTGEKIFMQSLCALGHMDFNRAGAYGYEQALDVALKLDLPRGALEQIFRRMVFNVLARNQDDHTKNMAFLMDRRGVWSLAPAFDVIYCYNPRGQWTSQHQMTMNGKRDGFVREDFHAVAKRFRLGRADFVEDVLQQTDGVIGRWRSYAAKAGVGETWTEEIGRNHRRLRKMG